MNTGAQETQRGAAKVVDYQKFMEQVGELQEQYAKLHATREGIQVAMKALEDLRKEINSIERVLKEVLSKAMPAPETTVREAQPYAGKTAIWAAEQVLKKHGKEMHLKTIVREILRGGYDQQRDAKKVYSNLFGALSRMAKNGKVFTKSETPANFGLLEWSEQLSIEA